jgi:hypothetical protein
MQIRIAAFAKKEHHHKISNIEMMTLPTGIANIVGTDCGTSVPPIEYELAGLAPRSSCCAVLVSR